MVVIRQVGEQYEVASQTFKEKFRTPFKALMAAHAIAFGEAGRDHQGEVKIVVPHGWGNDVVVKGSQQIQ